MHLRIELDKTFLERLRTSPRKSISELIWNAVDTDAETIQVELDANEMGGVTTITVTDDGHGMAAEEVRQSDAARPNAWRSRCWWVGHVAAGGAGRRGPWCPGCLAPGCGHRCAHRVRAEHPLPGKLLELRRADGLAGKHPRECSSIGLPAISWQAYDAAGHQETDVRERDRDEHPACR